MERYGIGPIARPPAERTAHPVRRGAPVELTGGFGIGTQVEVRDRFCSTWSRGFEIVAETDCGYTVRRLSDRYVLPTEFDAGEVRRAH